MLCAIPTPLHDVGLMRVMLVIPVLPINCSSFCHCLSSYRAMFMLARVRKSVLVALGAFLKKDGRTRISCPRLRRNILFLHTLLHSRPTNSLPYSLNASSSISLLNLFAHTHSLSHACNAPQVSAKGRGATQDMEATVVHACQQLLVLL